MLVGVQSAVGWKPIGEDMEVLESGMGRSGRLSEKTPEVQNKSNVGGSPAACQRSGACSMRDTYSKSTSCSKSVAFPHSIAYS